MLHHKGGLDSEPRTLLNSERLILERLQSLGVMELDRDIGAPLRFKGEGLDDALAGVVRVTDRGSGA